MFEALGVRIDREIAACTDFSRHGKLYMAKPALPLIAARSTVPREWTEQSVGSSDTKGTTWVPNRQLPPARFQASQAIPKKNYQVDQ
jgi:hypothetical protein